MRADEPLSLVMYPRRRSLFEHLLGVADQVVSQPTLEERLLGLAKEVGLSQLETELWRQGALLRLIPYRLQIR